MSENPLVKSASEAQAAEQLGEIMRPNATPQNAFTSLNLSDPSQALLFIKCNTEADDTSATYPQEGMMVEHIHCKRVIKRDDKGEILAEFCRTTLVDTEGRTCSFASQGVAESILMLMSWRGMPPWRPPIHLFLRKSGRFMQLLPAEILREYERKDAKKRGGK